MDSQLTIYISCAPEEFATLLIMVKKEVERLAYRPISIADCPSALDEQKRLEWIEAQINQSVGVLHFPGIQFGMPIEKLDGILASRQPSPSSIHHYEVLTAIDKAKQIWMILPKKGCTHDKFPSESVELKRAQQRFIEYLEAEKLLIKRAKNNQHFEQLLTEHYYKPEDLDHRLARKSKNSRKTKPSDRQLSGLIVATLAILAIGVGLFQHFSKTPTEISRQTESSREEKNNSANSAESDSQPSLSLTDPAETSATLDTTFTAIQYAICELQLQILAGEPPLSSWTSEQRESELASQLGWTMKQMDDALLLRGTSAIQRAQAFLYSNERARAEKEFDAILNSNADNNATSLAQLGKAIIAQDRGDHQNALEWFQKNAASIDRVKSPTLWADAHHPIAFQLAVLGRFEESKILLLKIIEAKVSSESDAQHRSAGVQRSLTRVLLAKSQAEEALPIMEKVLAADVKAHGENHALVALDHHLLASVYDSLADYDNAESSYRGALAIAESHYGEVSPHLLTTVTALAEFLHKRGKLTEAGPFYRRGLLIHDQKNDESSVAHASMLGNLAGLLFTLQKPEEAEPLFQQSIARFDKLNASSFAHQSAILTNYARLLEQQGRNVEAIATIQRTISIVENSLGKNHPQVANNLLIYARFLQQSQKNAEAELQLRRALAIDSNAYGDYHSITARDLEHLGDFLVANGRASQAEGPIRHALEIREINDGKRHGNYAANLDRLSVILASTNRRSEAVQFSRNALVIYATLGKNSDQFASKLADVIDRYRTWAPEDTLTEELAKIGKETGWSEEDWNKLTAP